MTDDWRLELDADILVPQLRVIADELRHHPHAVRVLQHGHPHTARSQQLLLTHERLVLADHDGADAVKQNRAAAHRAGRERRVDDGVAIHRGRLTSSVLERIHLAVQHRAAALHAAIVSTTDDASAMDDDRADRDAAL